MVVDNLDLCPNRVKHRELLKHTDEIVDLYTKDNLTLREIGFKFNTDKGAIKRILQNTGERIRTSREKNYDLVCKDCDKSFLSKCPTRLRCETCNIVECNKKAKEHYRSKNKTNINSCCLKCGNALQTERANRQRCDKCRVDRSRELKRQRRAKNPEKYRQKDLDYLHSHISHGQAVVANRRSKLYKRPGVLSTSIIKSVFKRDNYTCQYCFKRGHQLTNDHIVPLSKNGTNTEDNLTTACRTCNISKGNKSLLEFLLYLNLRERN